VKRSETRGRDLVDAAEALARHAPVHKKAPSFELSTGGALVFLNVLYVLCVPRARSLFFRTARKARNKTEKARNKTEKARNKTEKARNKTEKASK
jgi:hypothetical protein